MSHIPHFKVVGYDDWHGLYIDGKLHCQCHSIIVYDLVRASKGGPFTLSQEGGEALLHYMLEYNGLPDNYDDIPKEALQ